MQPGPEEKRTDYAGSTDLAMEANELAAQRRGGEVPGVFTESEEEDGIRVTLTDVQTEEAARSIGKLPGHYVTLEAIGLRRKDTDLQNRMATRFAKEFSGFLTRIGVSREAKTLIIGLGNGKVTADALGPIVVENVMVTRHYFELMPGQVSVGYRQVSAIAPGVLGTTGIESSEIVQGIVERIKPELVIAIDALASRTLERVNTTIQIADTGIHPGSGIGNKRRGLTSEILGVPVIAIGVPTVVYISSILNGCIDLMVRHFQKETENTDRIFGLLTALSENDRIGLVKEVLEPMGHNLIVTPKEIDQFIEDIANIIASGLNAALHAAIDSDNVAAYTH